jgi:TRAP-type C4-dicarboxylate transport system substrate-binding protein
MLEELKAKGLVITELQDLDAWKAASESVYKENAGFESLRSQIKQML